MMFEEKVKEPKLSDNLQGIINRSFGEKSISNTDETIRYKHKIMEVLLNCDDLLHTLHCTELDNSGDIVDRYAYKNVCIFDYMKLPEFKTNVRNYICFEIRDSNPFDSHITRRIIFRVVSHLDEMETDWGVNRPDLLACIIKNEFDWTNLLGISLMKQYDEASVADNDYYYREISYKIEVQNNPYNKINGKIING